MNYQFAEGMILNMAKDDIEGFSNTDRTASRLHTDAKKPSFSSSTSRRKVKPFSSSAAQEPTTQMTNKRSLFRNQQLNSADQTYQQ